MIFKNKKYQTPNFKAAFKYIYLNINKLDKNKNSKKLKNSKESFFVHMTGDKLNTFNENLYEIYQLKDLLIQEKLIPNNKGVALNL